MLLPRFSLVLVLIFSLAALSTPVPHGQAANTAQNPLANKDILEMHRAGLSPEVIIAKIKAGPSKFDTSPAAMKDLKSAGIPDNVILAMVEVPASTSQPGAADPAAKPAPSGEFAHLRVYRQRRFEGSALSPSIYVDDKQVVRIGNGRRCSIRLSPGPHTIRSDDKSSAISLEAKAGAEYFIRVDEQTGFWKGHGKLTMLLPEQGAAEYKLQKPVEEDRKIVKELIEDDGLGN
jgi:hypothetical protein